MRDDEARKGRLTVVIQAVRSPLQLVETLWFQGWKSPMQHPDITGTFFGLLARSSLKGPGKSHVSPSGSEDTADEDGTVDGGEKWLALGPQAAQQGLRPFGFIYLMLLFAATPVFVQGITLDVVTIPVGLAHLAWRRARMSISAAVQHWHAFNYALGMMLLPGAIAVIIHGPSAARLVFLVLACHIVIAVILTMAPGRRTPIVLAFACVVLGAAIALLAIRQVPVEAVNIPTGLAQIAWGVRNMRVQPGRGSWSALSFGLIVLVAPSVFVGITGSASLPCTLYVLPVCLILVGVGFRSRLQAPLVIGLLLLPGGAVAATRLLGIPWMVAVPICFVTVGVVVMAAGASMERRRRMESAYARLG